MSLTTIVPHDNCSTQQLFLSTFVPRNNYSSVPLQMVIYKEDGPTDDQNQGDGGARIVANDHPGDPASSVPLKMVVCKEDCPLDDQHFFGRMGLTCP